MSTYCFVLVSALLVAAQLAVTVARGAWLDTAARAEQVEARLDHDLDAWVDRTFTLWEEEVADGQVADAGEALNARSAAPADRLPRTAP